MVRNEFMEAALREAERSLELDEVPIGAVIVKDGIIIGRGFNSVETDRNPTMHAEMKAITEAAESVGGWRLEGCSMYVTCEPCSMCAGAIVWARIEELYIGAMNPKAGACGSVFDIVEDDRLNHRVDVHRGVMEEECGSMLSSFFRKLRKRRKAVKRAETGMEGPEDAVKPEGGCPEGKSREGFASAEEDSGYNQRSTPTKE
ncbi:MAG: tRNA adenosine(34) deaminase TadA [Eubacteriales bacterium]|nr:tRNA adenosine(34) deaminase TadA [Eubacteriales bacterium]